MAQFPNLSTEMTFRGKTHTNLVISEGMAPAEDMIISRTNDAETFIYEYGPEGNQTVVLAKGKIVDVVGEEYDSETGYKKTAVRQGKEASGKSIGVNLHNVYARRRDGMHSHLTKPTVITRNYIEVPLFETTDSTLDSAQKYARAMRFGAAVSATGADEVNLKHGDKVVSDNDGNFRKFDEATHSAADIVGTVWAKETNMPPAGFLQYYSEMVNPEMEAWINQMSRIPSPGIVGEKEAGAYPYGVPYQHKGWLPSYEEMLGNKKATGIPFLTDGFFRAQETLPIEVKKSNENVEAVRTTDKDKVAFDAEQGTLTVQPNVKNAAIFIKLKNKLDITQLENVVVNLDSNPVSANDLHIDVRNNTIVVYLEEQDSEKVYNKIDIVAPSIVSAVAGLPTEWDHKGSVGAVRILLQK